VGSATIQNAMDVPGRLAFGCTDLTAAWPHGGTGLGFMGTVFVDLDSPVYPVRAMEYGGEIVDEIAQGGNVMIRAVLRDDDPHAIEQAALNSAEGTVTQMRGIEHPGSNAAGYFYSTRGTVVVFTPESVIDGNDDQHDMVVFFNALPRLQEAASIAMHARAERQYPIAFRGIRDSSGRIYQIKRRADLSL
jgi:hypothetical protein